MAAQTRLGRCCTCLSSWLVLPLRGHNDLRNMSLLHQCVPNTIIWVSFSDHQHALVGFIPHDDWLEEGLTALRKDWLRATLYIVYTVVFGRLDEKLTTFVSRTRNHDSGCPLLVWLRQGRAYLLQQTSWVKIVRWEKNGSYLGSISYNAWWCVSVSAVCPAAFVIPSNEVAFVSIVTIVATLFRSNNMCNWCS